MTIAIPYINLYYTDEVNGDHQILPHTCLYTRTRTVLTKYYGAIRFCLSQLASSYHIEKQQSLAKWTFRELKKQNITSEQLYFWSAPMDLIERYQFYLDQLSIEAGDLSSANNEYYNCTLPRFGPQCQYKFIHDILSNSSFDESLTKYYKNVNNEMFSLTCYTHLQCDRTASLLCLDWREICDGKVDCLDSGLDEDRCWELELNECDENEFRCRNGQCIPKSLSRDPLREPHCIDYSDEPALRTAMRLGPCRSSYFPSFLCEEVSTYNYIQLRQLEMLRTNLSMQLMYSNKNPSLSHNCSLAFRCLLIDQNRECLKIVQNSCPQIIYFPNVPVVFTNIYFIYKRNELVDWLNISVSPFYICYNESQYDPYFNNYSIIIIDDMKCIDSRALLGSSHNKYHSTEELHRYFIKELPLILRKYHFSFNYNNHICNRSNIYQCMNSVKCISVYRLMDKEKDCPYDDDENATITSTIDYVRKNYFNCYNGKYISRLLIQDGNCQCGYHEFIWCPDENLEITFLKTNIVFQHVCDGFVDLLPILIDGRNESDETECQQWQCNNIYTRCNEILNCPNGADEAYCNRPVPLNCPSEWHQCVSSLTNELFCLSVEQLGNGIIDCLGATDETNLCGETLQWTSTMISTRMWFYCMNFSFPTCIDSSSFCNGYNECQNGDDEQFCIKPISEPDSSYCSTNYDNLSNAEQFLCKFEVPHRVWIVISFQLHRIIENNIEKQLKTIDNTLISSSSPRQVTIPTRLRYCHRGLDIDVWLNEQKKLSTNACLCPPSYYGDQCQYQTQRVSLTIKFQASAGSWRTLFAIIISLIDDSDQRLIHSYEQIDYLSARDCDSKFSKYLVYSTHPKDPNKNYSIHIDFYEKVSLKYRGSVLLPINFPFLPVHRLSFIVDIPRIREDGIESCLVDECDHGKCMRYANQPDNITFCQCHSGWTGQYCHIPHACNCSSDSLCVGISADNRSICVCAINKFGLRCLLTDTICQNESISTCQNGGQCIVNHHDMIFFQKFSCICPKNFTGDRCEIADAQLTITFERDIILPQSIFFHFIEIISWSFEKNNFTTRTTTYRSIPFQQDSVTVYWSESFRLVFTELANKNYYLTLVQNEYNQSTTIEQTVKSSDRCRNISELFNQTFLDLPLLRRIKYYHLPCQNRSLNLSCFYDETHLCLCYDFYQQRSANCFTFDHQMGFDCSGQSECQNGARCLQNKADCPTKSWCICPSCYYGQLCQFSTSGFHSSLDGILGYHILPNVRFVNQPFIIKMSFALAILFLVIGLIDGMLCLIVFTNETTREFGCGLYLLSSCVTTLLAIILFGFKYFILLLTQMQILSNQSFFKVQCRSLDFILQICLTMDQWLYACVAIERCMTGIQGTRFNKKHSVKAAKFVIIILLIVTIGSYIHDPIHRRVIEEENDLDDTKRTWCTVVYPSSLRVYNYVINIVHVLGPFLTNLISVIILIKLKAKQRSTVHTDQTYKQLLRVHFRELKHLIIAPIVLVILTVPRLITIFLSKCMQSSNDAWPFLIGYFISFIPTMLTFVIFVLPSQIYKVKFKNAIRRYRRTMQRRFHLYS